MSLLVLAAVLVMLLTAGFLLRPLLRAPTASPSTTAEQDLLTLRDRLLAQLDELESERRSERIDAAAAQAEQRRLESALAHVLKASEAPQVIPASAQTPARAGFAAAALVLLLPLAAAGLYVWQHSATLTIAMSGPAAPDIPPMALEMVARLEKRLQQQPDDAPGWARLGRAYSVLQRPAEAVGAYGKAHQLAPNDRAILADYAWLLYERNPGEPDAQTVALYRKLLRMEPEHQPALWVLGIAAYRAQNEQQALVLWQKLLTLLPPDSPAAQSVRHAVQGIQSNKVQK